MNDRLDALTRLGDDLIARAKPLGKDLYERSRPLAKDLYDRAAVGSKVIVR